MRTLSFAILCGALITAGARLHAEEPAISISIGVPAHNEERRIEDRDKTSHFHVVVSNVSDKPQRIWREWCSWGYFGLTFEITDARGNKSVARRSARDWTRNFPDWWTLEPHESLVLDVLFADAERWEGFPRPDNGSQAVTMQAIFEFAPDDDSRKHDVWTGRVVSKADKFVFYRWRTEEK